jgi:hypothetical protein
MVECSWNVMAHGDAWEGKWRGNWWMEWVASTLHTTSKHGVFSITTNNNDDAHTSGGSSQLNWCPCQFKWTRPFHRKMKSGFCMCAIIFQMQSTGFSLAAVKLLWQKKGICMLLWNEELYGYIHTHTHTHTHVYILGTEVLGKGELVLCLSCDEDACGEWRCISNTASRWRWVVSYMAQRKSPWYPLDGRVGWQVSGCYGGEINICPWLMGDKLKFHGCLACKACSKVIFLTTQRGGQTKTSG